MYYYQVRGQQHGPVSQDQLQHLAGEGTISPGTLVKEGDEGKWQFARSLGGLTFAEKKAKRPAEKKSNGPPPPPPKKPAGPKGPSTPPPPPLSKPSGSSSSASGVNLGGPPPLGPSSGSSPPGPPPMSAPPSNPMPMPNVPPPGSGHTPPPMMGSGPISGPTPAPQSYAPPASDPEPSPLTKFSQKRPTGPIDMSYPALRLLGYYFRFLALVAFLWLGVLLIMGLVDTDNFEYWANFRTNLGMFLFCPGLVWLLAELIYLFIDIEGHVRGFSPSATDSQPRA